MAIGDIRHLRKNKENHIRPITVSFRNTIDKRKVMASTDMLREARKELNDIIITYDLNMEEQEQTRKLAAHAKEITAADNLGTIYNVIGPHRNSGYSN